MTVTSTTVKYDIVGTDNTSKAFNSASKSASKMGTAVSKAANIAKKSAEVIGVAAVAAGVDAIHQAAKFQSSMTLLVTAGGESEKALGKVASGIKKVATQTGTSTSQLAEGMYVIEKAGFRGANGLNVLKVSAEAAKAENVDLSTMTNAVTSAMTSYHLPASKAVTITNEMVAAAGAAKTTMSNYAGALSTVLPIASAAGISFAQVGGAIATLTNHGTSAEEATQELANTIRNLQAPNNVAVNEMAQLGLSSNDVSTKLGKRGLTGTLELLSQTVLKKMGPSGTVLLNTFNASKIAGQDADTMLKNLPPAAQKMAKAYAAGTLSLNGYRQGLKKLPADQAALAQQWATTENKSKGFNSALRAGGQPAQTYTKAIKDMTGGATGLNTVLQLTGDNTGRFNANVKTVTDASKHAGSNISTWAKTQKNFNVQWDRFKEGLHVAAINAGSKLLGPLSTMVTFINNKVLPAAGNAGGKIAGMFGDLKPAVSGATDVVGTFFSSVIAPDAKKAAGQIDKIFGGVGGAVKKAGQQSGDFLEGLAGKPIKPKHASSVEDIVAEQTGLDPTKAALAGKKVHDAVQKAFGGIDGILGGQEKKISDFWKTFQGAPIKPKHASSVSDIVAEQTGVDPTDAAKAGKKFHDTLQGIYSGGKFHFDKLGQAIGDALVASVLAASKAADKIGLALVAVISKVPWAKIGKAAAFAVIPFAIGFVNNLLNSIVSEAVHHPLDMLQFILTLIPVGRAAGALLKVLDKLFPESKLIVPLARLVLSPLEKAGGAVEKGIVKAFGGIGKAVWNGIKDGVSGEFPATERWISTHLSGGLTAPFKSIGETVYLKGLEVMDSIRGGISGGTSKVVNGIIKVGKSIVSGLFKGITGSLVGIGRWVSTNIVDPLVYGVKDLFGIHSPSTVFAGIGKNLMDGLIGGVGAGFKAVASWFRAMPGRVGGYFKGAGSWLVSKGSSILGGLWSGVSSRYVAIGKWFGGWASRAAGYFKGGSTWLYSAGVSIMGGLASGFAAKLEGLKDVFKTPIQWILDNVLNPFIHALGHIPGLGSLEKVNLSLGGGTSNAKNQLDAGFREGGVVARKKGGPIAPHGLAWVGEEGPELIRVSGQAMVYPHQKSLQMAKGAGKLPGFALGGIIEGAKIAGSGALGEAAKVAKAAVSHIPGLSTFQTVADSVINTALGWAQSKLQADQKKANASGGAASGAHGDMSAHSASAAKAQAYAKSLLSQFGWAANQMTSLISLWNGESGWNNLAANPTSTAFGIAQFLNGTWAGKKFPKTTNFMQQVYDGFQYIKGSYGSPSKAYSSWLGRSPHWYAKGGKPKANELAWVGEEGPELVKFGGPAEVYPHDKSMVMAKSMGRVAGFATGGKVGSGTKDSAKSYVSHLTAQIKLSSTNEDIRKFTAAILDKIAKTKYSATQRAFLNNYVTDAENTALKKQAGSKSSFGSKLIQGILASFGGSSTTSSINTATASVISRINQAFTGKARSGLVSYTQRVNVQMEKLATARDKITAKIAAANELSTSVTSGAKDFASIAGLTSGSTKTLSREFRSKLASISNFAKNIKLLKKMGYSSDLISQILGEGIDQAAPLAEQLVKATPAGVRGFNATQRAINRVSKSLGTVAVNAQFGKSAATNFVASLRSQQASLEKQMRALAKVFAKGVGHAFHLKGYAKGGLAKGLAIVGERGPEIADFGTRGAMITPNLAALSPSGDTSGLEKRLGNIENLLEMYLDAGHNLEVSIDGRRVTKAINDQNARTGPGSRVGTRRAS